MEERQAQLIGPFRPAEKQLAEVFMNSAGEERLGFTCVKTKIAIFNFEVTVICLRHLYQIWFNLARAFERSHIFIRWKISDIM